LWSNKVIDEKIDYIHKNPVEEGNMFLGRKIIYIAVLQIMQGRKDYWKM